MENIKLESCFDYEKNFGFYCFYSFGFVNSCFLAKYDKYNDEWILGKTKEQIVEKYGDFEWYVPKKDANEQVIYYVGMYTVKPKRVGSLGTKQANFFCIKFNMDNIAVECYEKQAGQGG